MPRGSAGTTAQTPEMNWLESEHTFLTSSYLTNYE